MKSINKIILIGRLGADPVLRQTKTGYAVTQFSVATKHRSKKPQTDEFHSFLESETHWETQWHRVIVWGRLAETCCHYLQKGHQVYIEGSLRHFEYEDQFGKDRSGCEIHSEIVCFLSNKKSQPLQKKPEPLMEH